MKKLKTRFIIAIVYPSWIYLYKHIYIERERKKEIEKERRG